MTNPIDLRSDTVTRPDRAMREAMANAEVGDDVYGDDPSINRLQSMAAELLGQEATLFFPTGTQSNLCALLTHCGRGDEYIVGSDAHTYKWEGGGAAVLGGIQPQTVPFGENGALPLDEVAKVIKPRDVHYARSRLLCLENTQHGRVQPLGYFDEARTFAHAHGLSLHLDGARMANAAVALGEPLEALGKRVDTLSLCLSKGLGAPVGSLLAGPRDFIEEARRWRKVAGGGMRQAGVLAAAAEIAITAGFDRLHEDHENASRLAESLSRLEGVHVREGWTQTNMVWIDFDAGVADDFGDAFQAYAAEHGVLLSARGPGARLVLHRDVSARDLDAVVAVFEGFEGFRRARGSGDGMTVHG